MSVRVTVQDKGIGMALATMTKLLSGQMAPIYRAVGSKVESNVHVRFDTKSDPDGKPWAEWSQPHAAKRKKEGRGTILEYTGRMRDSLTYVADNEGVEVGFGVDYAQWNEPTRHMLFSAHGGLSEEDKNDALNAAMKALRRQLKAVGVQ
jgi:phage gpG-like protein